MPECARTPRAVRQRVPLDLNLKRTLVLALLVRLLHQVFLVIRAFQLLAAHTGPEPVSRPWVSRFQLSKSLYRREGAL